ncbi:hypothetical protein M1N79_03685 [Dehalococcoidia bacterium]|nr:hypothetical protein [Dehalococcoidia bacterium]
MSFIVIGGYKNEIYKLTPHFSVKNVKDTILFYQDILGFKLEMVVPNNENIIEQNISEGKIYNYAMMSKDEVFEMFLEEDSFEKDVPLLEDTPQGAPLLLYGGIPFVQVVG